MYRYCTNIYIMYMYIYTYAPLARALFTFSPDSTSDKATGNAFGQGLHPFLQLKLETITCPPNMRKAKVYVGFCVDTPLSPTLGQTPPP